MTDIFIILLCAATLYCTLFVPPPERKPNCHLHNVCACGKPGTASPCNPHKYFPPKLKETLMSLLSNDKEQLALQVAQAQAIAQLGSVVAEIRQMLVEDEDEETDLGPVMDSLANLDAKIGKVQESIGNEEEPTVAPTEPPTEPPAA